MENLPEEIDHQKRIAACVWLGLLSAVESGQRTVEEVEAMYQEWFPDYEHGV